ncbi:MAG: winged helix DNA-binding domain-containing protein [Propionibacteriaceae bacterium]|nr:winged helix DNA-binding domain-containing protein [Propionibacteriaceae bacterium]
MTPVRLSLEAARRVALAAQGFGRPRPAAVGMRQVAGVIDQVAQFQIDSVNVAVRAHYMPLFARLGPYDPALLDRAAGRAPRRLVEYWGHAASLIDVELFPALRWRMGVAAQRERDALTRIRATKPDLEERVLADVAAGGPLTPREIENVEERSRAHWGWNWSEVKHILEHHFTAGTVGVASRNSAFERRYDLVERVVPPEILARGELDADAARLAFVRRAARALGVADLKSLATYFYLRTDGVRRAVAALEASGELIPATVRGLAQPFWLWHGARRPRTVDAHALVSPFDSLVFDRPRVEQLFDAEYRIEIYVPAPQRVHGYYVYLFVHGDRIAARVDLKADRAAGVLRVQAAWLEEGAPPDATAAALASELHLMAGWLGLIDVRASDRGTLAGRLSALL